MANIALAADFLEKFRSESQSLSERVVSASSQDKQAEKESFLSAISKLRKDLIDANPYLPTYDQRTSELQLKSLEKQLDGFIEGPPGVSGKARAGSKFSFKRSVQPSGATPVKQTTSVPEVTPKDILAASVDSTESAGIGESPQGSSKDSTNHGKEAQNAVSETQFDFHDRSREFLTWSELKSTDNSEGTTDISLSSLSECVVNLVAGREDPSTGSQLPRTIRAFHAKGLRRCVIMIPNVQGSALIHDCEDCVIAVSAYQFRIHTSTHIDVYLRVTSTPVIEKCKAMRFAPYTLPQSVVPVEGQRENQFANVQDFSWIRAAASPNWSLLGTAEVIKETQWPLGQVGDIDACLNALLPPAPA